MCAGLQGGGPLQSASEKQREFRPAMAFSLCRVPSADFRSTERTWCDPCPHIEDSGGKGVPVSIG